MQERCNSIANALELRLSCTNPWNIDGLVQGRRNSIANALELRLSCTNPWICFVYEWTERTCLKILCHFEVFTNTTAGVTARSSIVQWVRSPSTTQGCGPSQLGLASSSVSKQAGLKVKASDPVLWPLNPLAYIYSMLAAGPVLVNERRSLNGGLWLAGHVGGAYSVVKLQLLFTTALPQPV